MEMMTEEKALSWIADIFEEPVDNIQSDTSREDIPGWDSLGILTLMASLDEDLDILLSEKEIQELRKIEDILEALRRNDRLS